ncbi:alpha/beta hydrolase-fold protein [uncultured Imperialibacter sp.]|uniref:alpha/beta hydrolase-fold protein n=1 Tax=uncultured Imperialibacter sp. TaxID=1672639 RepID=UPI0030D892D2|tara:strand:- start:167750 stop:168955 length:1206 start_codon:yes stop_codon:yes gene_type:complete
MRLRIAKGTYPVSVMRKALPLLFLSFSLFNLNGQPATDIVIGRAYSIDSEVLGETRQYMVSLPASYQGDDFYIDKSYPVMIVLDGERLLQLTASMVQTMSSGGTEQIPEMIVIGIPNTDRSRDMLPNYANEAVASGAVEFRRFIEEELLPAADIAYRTTNCRILVGHSYSGLFAVDTFLENDSFKGFVAIDPSLWWDDQVLIKRAKELLAKKETFTSSIYFGQANNPFNEGIEAGRLGRAVQAFTRTLDTLHVAGLRYQTHFYENEDHYSIPLITLYDGLQYLFEGYKFPLNQIKHSTAESIRQHYNALSERMGGQLPPPGKLLNQVGLYLLEDEERIADAIKILELSAESYPNSHIPYLSLAEGYRQAGDTEKAITQYKRALELSPANEEIKSRLAELKN